MKPPAILVFLTMAGFLAQPGHAQILPGGVTLQVVKFAGLKEAILRNRGKVVLVDFWSDGCLPCKKGFPHVVELHQKYGREGLAVVSVNLDPAAAGTKEKILNYLRTRGATFTNLILDEPVSVWQEKLHFDTIPTLYLFDRQGKWTMIQPTDQGLPYQDLEKLVLEYLRERAP